MGALTTGVSVPEALINDIKKDDTLLRFLLGQEETEDSKWELDTFDFDKCWEERIGILRAAGLESVADALDFETYDNNGESIIFEGIEVWIIEPKLVKKVSADLASHTFQSIKAKALENEATDYYGKIIPEGDYSGYIGDLEAVKAFLEKCAQQEHYLVLSTD